MELRILEYLDNIQENNGVAISARLCCTCGNCFFEFSHTGRKTRGILAPYIIRKNKQLILKANCSKCGNEIVVYNSQLDGSNPKITEEIHEFTTFTTKKSSKFEVVIKYNYFPEKLKEGENYSNQFEECFIYIIDNGKETKALIEETHLHH